MWGLSLLPVGTVAGGHDSWSDPAVHAVEQIQAENARHAVQKEPPHSMHPRAIADHLFDGIADGFPNGYHRFLEQPVFRHAWPSSGVYVSFFHGAFAASTSTSTWSSLRRLKGRVVHGLSYTASTGGPFTV